LSTAEQSNIKIAVLNLIINLAWKDIERDADTKVRKQIIEMNLVEMLSKMKAQENDREVKE
jgi:hypothetical protein